MTEGAIQGAVMARNGAVPFRGLFHFTALGSDSSEVCGVMQPYAAFSQASGCEFASRLPLHFWNALYPSLGMAHFGVPEDSHFCIL